MLRVIQHICALNFPFFTPNNSGKKFLHHPSPGMLLWNWIWCFKAQLTCGRKAATRVVTGVPQDKN